MANWDHKSNIGTHPNIDNGASNTLDNLSGSRPPEVSQRVDDFIPVGAQVTVTIGRNVGSSPMSTERWQRFQTAVLHHLETFCSTTFGPFHGTGEWEGVSEESAVLIGLVTYPASPKRLELNLGLISREYGQDAIAVSYGPSILAS